MASTPTGTATRATTTKRFPLVHKLLQFVDIRRYYAYVAYALGPIPREERAQQARLYLNTRFTTKQQLFIDFVLQHYVTMGVQELAQEKLAPPCSGCDTRTQLRMP